MMHRTLLWFVVLSSFINAVPAIAQFHPLLQRPIADELMGSGHETDEVRSPRPHRYTAKPARRPDTRRVKPPLDEVMRAIVAAQRQLLASEPELGLLISRRDPAIKRNDVVGTMVWAGNTIMFNRAYVASLSPRQLYEHLWQLAAALTTPT